jgi:hypothetical protein
MLQDIDLETFVRCYLEGACCGSMLTASSSLDLVECGLTEGKCVGGDNIYSLDRTVEEKLC